MSRRTPQDFSGVPGPSNGSRQARDLPISSYGAPPSHIDSNAIGFNGIRSLGQGRAPATATTSSGPLNPAETKLAEELINSKLSLADENVLPRSQRNILKRYRTQNGLPDPFTQPPIPEAANPIATTSKTLAGRRAAATRAGARVPDLTRKTTRAAVALDSADLSAYGNPSSDLLPNSNGAGAQKRDLFGDMFRPSRAGTHADTDKTPSRGFPGASATSSRSTVTAIGRTGALGLTSVLNAPAMNGDGTAVSGILMRAPSSGSSAHSQSGSETGRRRAAAAAANVVVPDSGSSLGTLSTRGRSFSGTSSGTASEGEKHTRGPQRRGAAPVATSSSNASNANNTPAAKGKARQVDAHDNDVGDETVRAEQSSASTSAAPARSYSAHTPRFRAKIPAARPAPRPKGPSLFHSFALVLIAMIGAVLLTSALQSGELGQLALKAGIPPAWIPAGFHKLTTPVQANHETTSAGLALPHDLVRTSELDHVYRKLDQVSVKRRRKDSDFEQAIAELQTKLGVSEEDMVKIVYELKAVASRVDAVEDKVKKTHKAIMSGAALGVPGGLPGNAVTVADLRLMNADRTGREDLANPLAGARVIPEITTWDSWWGGRYGVKPRNKGFFWRSRLTGSKDFSHSISDPNAHNPQWALLPIAQVGHCWQFPGAEAQLGIELIRPAKIGAFTIEHVQRELVPDRNSAPLDVELWGIADADDTWQMGILERWKDWKQNELVAAKKEAETQPPNGIPKEWNALVAEGADQPQPTPPADNYVLLGSMRYSLDGHEVQTAEIRPTSKELNLKFSKVLLRFKGNHGAENTCVYRVRVHPERENAP
ncbi:hypothetical protein OC846_002357 [Tilletia horrida]|uniref:SUN domain-containing protein n=1 Tax=Tilletia horrida TaxID=155126 RepID=A0AAN6GX73_9BASI|nr:hypothetical protein OC846_002357 [Tilletia horrida]KAK0567789.1 hypothetical protein OC861_002532 [Tilletia horrida]